MKIIKNADIIISCVLLVMLTVVALLQVLFRFLLNLPLSWTEELVRYCVISLIYISTVYSIRTRGVIRVEILDQLLKGKVKHALNSLINFCSAGVMFFMSYLCISLVQNAISVNQRSAAMNIPVAVMYGVECGSFFLMGLAFIFILSQDIRNLVGGNEQ